MSSITDIPEVASEIAEPADCHHALGLMDARPCDRRLGRLTEMMADDRYFCGDVVSLAENPFRNAFWTGLKRTPTRFV